MTTRFGGYTPKIWSQNHMSRDTILVRFYKCALVLDLRWHPISDPSIGWDNVEDLVSVCLSQLQYMYNSKIQLWHVGIIFWLLITNIYFRKYKFWEDIHRCECVLAGIYQRHGKSTKALRHWEEAYQAACKSGDKESQAEALKAKSEVQHPISSHLAKTKLLLNDDGSW